MRTGPALAMAIGLAFGSPALSASPVNESESGAVVPGTAQANVAIVRRFLEEVVNGGRFELVDDLWAPDLVWRGGSLGEVHGLAAYRQMLEASVGGSFTGMHLDIKDVVAADDKVVVRFTNSGFNTGSFMGHPATGRHAVWEGIGIYRIDKGKIAEAWFSEDIVGMYQALGILD